MKTVWIFGDQLNREIASLRGAEPEDTRILMVRNKALLEGRRWHRQRLHLVLTAMTRFAGELRSDGFEVDEQEAKSFTAGLRAHKRRFEPDSVTAMETLSAGTAKMLATNAVETLDNNQMLCHYSEFAQWAGSSERLRMEDFYRWQRQRLDILMDGDEPVGGRWNYDSENRLPPPKQTRNWYDVLIDELDDTDRNILKSLPKNAVGADTAGLWPTTRSAALKRLQQFVDEVLPEFGPYEDAMLVDEFRLAHSMLSSSMNLGLLTPHEVISAAESAFRDGKVPIASAEGFIRQIIGWREYIWNVYWRWIPEYRTVNALEAKEPLPPMFHDGKTKMNCMANTLADVNERAWAHHIQRLMVLGNFSLIANVRPQELVEWMWVTFIDGAEWVMLPNVLGLSQYADGGRMSTKPYASGGAYINRMSNYCKDCVYDPKKRVGEEACPFTTLYWDFIDRNKKLFSANHRMAQPVRNLERLSDLDDVRKRARKVRKLMRSGDI